MHGNITLSGHGNVTINATNEIHTTAHRIQTTTSDGNATYNQNGKTEINGNIDSDETAKNQQYTALLNQTYNASLNAIKSTPAEKVTCPNCAQQHLVDDKSDPWNIILDRIISTFSNIPWMQGPLGVLRFAVTKIYVRV